MYIYIYRERERYRYRYITLDKSVFQTTARAVPRLQNVVRPPRQLRCYRNMVETNIQKAIAYFKKEHSNKKENTEMTVERSCEVTVFNNKCSNIVVCGCRCGCVCGCFSPELSMFLMPRLVDHVCTVRHVTFRRVSYPTWH